MTKCGCRIEQYYSRPTHHDLEEVRIVYCPLHAAAPKLLEAAQDMTNQWEEFNNQTRTRWDLRKIDNAIAHAKGGSCHSDPDTHPIGQDGTQ